MNFKDSSSLRSSLVGSYSTTLDLDLTEGTPERDVFVEAPITGQLLDIWTSLQYLYKLQAPFLYTTDLLEEDLDTFCNNYDVGQITATYSTGEVTFYTYTQPTVDIVIDPSKSATDGTTKFSVTGYYTLPLASSINYYNAATRRWEITCSVISNTSGPDGTAGAGTVNRISGSITGIEGCTNNTAISGGQAAGDISARVQLVKRKFKGRNLNTTEGIKLYVESFSRSVNIVGSNDPLMLRTAGLGGGMDIYIKDVQNEGTVDTVTITSTGLLPTVVDRQYTSTGIIFLNQPVSTIALVSKNGTTLNTTYYRLTKDAGLLKNSTRSLDQMTLTTTGIINIGYFVPGDVVEMRYNYNKLLHTIEDELNSSYNQYDNRDYLLREQDTVIVDIYMTIKPFAGYTIDGIKSSSSLSLESYESSFTGDYVEFADILGIVKNTNGVDNIDVPTAHIEARDGRTKTLSGDIPIGKNEYPQIGALYFTLWS